jgi:hypothetical protein
MAYSPNCQRSIAWRAKCAATGPSTASARGLDVAPRAGGSSWAGFCSGTESPWRAPGIDRAPGDKPGSGRFVGQLIGDEHGTGMVAISS